MSASQFNDPAANAPDAAAYKGKGKAVEDPSQDLSMDEETEESENENENENEEVVSYSICLFDLITRWKIGYIKYWANWHLSIFIFNF